MKEALSALARIDIEKSDILIGDGGAFLRKIEPNEAFVASPMKLEEGIYGIFGTSWAVPSTIPAFSLNFDNTFSLLNHEIKGYWPSQSPSPITPDVDGTFKYLVSKWYETASASSNLTKRMLNENFLRIIGLGEPAIPFLLLELKTKPSLLIEALRAITRRIIEGQNQMSFDEEVQDWLKWGEESGYF